MSISVLLLRFLIEGVERVGVSRDQLLKATGFSPTRLAEHDARLPTSEYNRVLLAALRLSHDHALGLHLGEQSRSATFGLLGLLTDHASTLRQGLDTVMRYQGILSDVSGPTLSEQGQSVLIRFAFPAFDAPGLRIASDFAMSGLLRLIRMFVGPKARPHGVFFKHRAPQYWAEYQRIFEGTQHFGHDFTGIEFPRTWLDRTQLSKNPELYAVLQAQAERALGRLKRDGNLTELVLEQLASSDPSRTPLMKDIARGLGLSDRSLRRRLAAQGVEYKDLNRQARIRIAKRLLESPHASIQETAYAMGFATPAAFHRAFKRWTGMTPKQYRSSY